MGSKIKKFGTFGGVFTPSILTILGVIMYLRFPSILGQTGLINTLGIIVVAHIISFSTSLSLASLSTDKAVKTGGTYFMISRSLGLPIGGTLGFSLFVGLCLSVSLYLIGFTESFLSFWDMDQSINSIRFTGTIVLMIVTTITFISTSLAIKSQYLIMTAMVLSLLSIFFGNHDFTPEKINLQPIADAAPFMLLFGIFFPAVCGFEAGVAMSGDLKDPKKSLPLGAVSAVSVGFVIYIILALYLTYTVDSYSLANDKDILFKIALVPGLVIAGIWGATLSSALGSILGAPRILQAIAMDKIAPKFFARGTGKANEPRNALLMAFVIAEIGILIGELDLIARIVSMFFITTYAFLNLASAIESWSSSDFRPAFRTPKFISIIGAAAAFIVMILLDFPALMGATVVLGLIFFFLKRRELTLESGDAWSSFWANLAKHSLLSLSKEKVSRRNWRPNIILFRGGEQERMHLVDLGLAISGKLGSLTDFELLIKSEKKASSVPQIQSTKESTKEIRFFKRKFETESLEEGLKAVTSVYGFSGFEPNTIMMGWSRNVQNADVLVNALNDFRQKDLNAIFLDYDKVHGFGKKSSIDIWWGGIGPHLNFSLELVKFMLSDHAWRDARVRIMVINNDKTISDHIHNSIKALLNEKRIEAEIKIVSNDPGTRSVEMTIMDESEQADLVMMGISDITTETTTQYVERINYLSNLQASLLILSASAEFESINLIDAAHKLTQKPRTRLLTELKPLPVIENATLKERIERLDETLLEAANTFIEKSIQGPTSVFSDMIVRLREFTESNFKKLDKATAGQAGSQLTKAITGLHYDFLGFYTDFLSRQTETTLAEIKSMIEQGTVQFQKTMVQCVQQAPENILITYKNEQTGRKKKHAIRYRNLLEASINSRILPAAMRQLSTFHQHSERLYTDLRIIIVKINDIYEQFKLISTSGVEVTAEVKERIIQELIALEKQSSDLINENNNALAGMVRNQAIKMGESFLKPGTRNRRIISRRRKRTNAAEAIAEFPELWEANIQMLNNAVYLDCALFMEQEMIGGILSKNNEKLYSLLQDQIITPLDNLLKNIENAGTDDFRKLREATYADGVNSLGLFQETYHRITELIERLPDTLNIARTRQEDDHSGTMPYPLEAETIEPAKLALHYFDSRFYDPFYHELEQFNHLLHNTAIECRETNSLLVFRLNNEGREEALRGAVDIKLFLSQLERQVKEIKAKLDKAYNRLSHKSDVLLKDAFAPLFSFLIVQSKEKVASLQRARSGRELGKGFINRIASIKEKVNHLIVGLLYSSSDGLILAKKYLRKRIHTKTSIKQVLDIAEDEIPDTRTLSQIPVFYRSLFSSKALITDGFWVPMQQETETIQRSIKRHNAGFGGAVLITGVHGAGKTALTRHCMGRFFKKERTFYLNAPMPGSTDPGIWLVELQRATGGTGNASEILQNLPPKSAVVINDLELWWERTNDGYEIVRELTQHIRTFGRNILFVMNCNTYAFNQMNKAFPLEDYFLSIVECRPFDTRKLQQLILNRHKSSGLIFHYRNSSEKALLQLRIAALFHVYFNYSQGIPGVAMNAWISNIEKVNQKNITISRPEVPNLDKLDDLDKDWLIAIALFIQHKNITSAKLARIMDLTEDEANELLENLLNSGIIEPREEGVLTLNKYLEPFMVKTCFDKGII